MFQNSCLAERLNKQVSQEPIKQRCSRKGKTEEKEKIAEAEEAEEVEQAGVASRRRNLESKK